MSKFAYLYEDPTTSYQVVDETPHGIYDDDKIINPGYDAWKDVLNSDEAGKAFSNVTNQSGKSAVSAPFPVIDKFYSNEYKKYSNAELEPAYT